MEKRAVVESEMEKDAHDRAAVKGEKITDQMRKEAKRQPVNAPIAGVPTDPDERQQDLFPARK